MDSAFVTSVCKDGGQGDSCLWLRVEDVDPAAITLTIVDKAEAQSWTTQVTNEIAASVCKLYGLDVEEYWKIIKDELKNVSGNFKYVIKAGRFRIEKISSGQIKFVYANLALKETPFAESMSSLFETLLDSHSKLKKENEELKSRLADVTEDRTIFQEKLEKFTDESVMKEETLLVNFLLLLNAKKSEIKKLQEGGKAGSEVSPDEEYDVDTDIDDEENASATPPREEPTASTTKRKRAEKTVISNDLDDVMDLQNDKFTFKFIFINFFYTCCLLIQIKQMLL